MIKIKKYKLYPNKEQLILLNQQLESHRRIYNWGITNRLEIYEKEKRSISYVEQAKQIPVLRSNNEFYARCNCASVQQTLRRVDRTFKNFFRLLKTGKKTSLPKTKSQNNFKSFGYAYLGNGCCR